MNKKIDRVKSFFAEPARYLRYSVHIQIRATIVREFTGDTVFKSILDVGCGTGAISKPLLQRTEHLTFLDFSPSMLSIALRSVPVESLCKVESINDDFMRAELKSNSYDLILCMGVLAHVASPISVVDKMIYLLKPGGHIIIQNTDSRHPISYLSAIYAAMRNIFFRNSYRMNRISGASLTQMLRDHGLVQLSIYRYGVPVPWIARILTSDSLCALIIRIYGTPAKNRFSWLGNECIYYFKDLEKTLNSHAKCNAGIDRSCDGSEV